MDEKEAIDFRNETVSVTIAVEPPPMPPPGITSPFNTISEWLHHLATTNNPGQPIENYQFGLIYTPSTIYMSLLGWNEYPTGVNGVAHRIDFKPATHMYFPLPKDIYGDLTTPQLHKQLFDELRQFTTTPIFQNSFLTKGDQISTNFAGKIWSK